MILRTEGEVKKQILIYDENAQLFFVSFIWNVSLECRVLSGEWDFQFSTQLVKRRTFEDKELLGHREHESDSKENYQVLRVQELELKRKPRSPERTFYFSYLV